MTVRTALLAALLTLPVSAAPVVPGELAELVLRSVAPTDGKAVIQRPSGELELLDVGDSLATGVVVREVLPDRLVLEETLPPTAEGEPGEKRRIWIFKADSSGHRSRVQVLERTRPQEPELRQPKSEAGSERPADKESEDSDAGEGAEEG